MHPSVAQKIVEAGAEAGLDLSLRENYSGRGMFGRTTCGVVGDLGEILQAIVAAAYEAGAEDANSGGDSDFVRRCGRLSWDSMGRDAIVY